jgi:hypothetical protein
MLTLSRAENIAYTAMYTYKGGEQNFSPGTIVGANNKIPTDRADDYVIFTTSKE